MAIKRYLDIPFSGGATVGATQEARAADSDHPPIETVYGPYDRDIEIVGVDLDDPDLVSYLDPNEDARLIADLNKIDDADYGPQEVVQEGEWDRSEAAKRGWDTRGRGRKERTAADRKAAHAKLVQRHLEAGTYHAWAAKRRESRRAAWQRHVQRHKEAGTYDAWRQRRNDAATARRRAQTAGQQELPTPASRTGAAEPPAPRRSAEETAKLHQEREAHVYDLNRAYFEQKWPKGGVSRGATSGDEIMARLYSKVEAIDKKLAPRGASQAQARADAKLDDDGIAAECLKAARDMNEAHGAKDAYGVMKAEARMEHLERLAGGDSNAPPPPAQHDHAEEPYDPSTDPFGTGEPYRLQGTTPGAQGHGIMAKGYKPPTVRDLERRRMREAGDEVHGSSDNDGNGQP